jgi:hypothetical protein
MDLERLYGGSFIDWSKVEGSWAKRTIPSRLLLFASRKYLEEDGLPEPDMERAATLSSARFPEEIRMAYASPPANADAVAAQSWGIFVDAAVATEMELISYGERPLLLHELRAGFAQAAEEAGDGTPLARWFVVRAVALPGGDLPETPDYLPV